MTYPTTVPLRTASMAHVAFPHETPCEPSFAWLLKHPTDIGTLIHGESWRVLGHMRGMTLWCDRCRTAYEPPA